MESLQERASARRVWLRKLRGDRAAALAPASADASFSSDWRTRHAGQSGILLNSPPALEDPAPWRERGAWPTAAGLHVPAVRAQDLEQGFLRIEDSGGRLYLPTLNDSNWTRGTAKRWRRGCACIALWT